MLVSIFTVHSIGGKKKNAAGLPDAKRESNNEGLKEVQDTVM